MPEGALDNDFDEAAVPAREQLLADQPELTAPVAGGLAVDLVTRQLLFVRREVAPDLPTYYDEEDFDLLNYGPHPYLPVTVDDAVLECVYIDDVGVQDLDGLGDSKTYDFPRGRLAAVPIQEVWADAD
jgi:hypothetical protein